MMREVLAKVVARKDLSSEEMATAMAVVFRGEATDAQVGAFAASMRMKGETEEELLGAAQAMRACADAIR